MSLTLGERASKFFNELSGELKEGVAELNKDCLKYSAKVVGDLFLDYWDFALVAVAGMAFGDNQNEHLGSELRVLLEQGKYAVIFGPAVERVLYKNSDGASTRLFRNLTAGLSGFFLHESTFSVPFQESVCGTYFVAGSIMGMGAVKYHLDFLGYKKERNYGKKG